MAGTTSWIISNLMSTFDKLSQYMHPFPSLPASSFSSSSSIPGEATAAKVNSINERLMEDLNRLARMLRRIQSVLHDAEEREFYDQTIKLWLSELREVAYDVEDVLDEYDYQLIKTQLEEMIAGEAEPSLKRKRVVDDHDDDEASLPSSTSMYNMAKRIMEIIEKFDEITKDRVALQLREEDGIRLPSFDDAMKRPPSSSLMHESDVFGREDDKEKIIQLLISDSKKENTVIPIIGLGGVGKTTLAQLVYNDPAVCEYFSPKVWVCVSEEFDVVRVTKEIVTSIIGSMHDNNNNNNLNDLQSMLKKALLDKRFLLILDDIWNERLDKWEALRAPFSGVGMGKIIVTTRSKSVARIMQTMPPHELRCLDEEKSWLLFQRHAFCGWELDQQLNLEQIGRQIARKCAGLPLALKAIGGFLRYEAEEQKWLDVLNNDLWELEETKNLILPALRISYNHLPAHLKPCFVYASLFPKDHMFEKEELIRLWIAQGYIQPTGRKRLLEDIACEYFDDLQRRSFFQCLKYVNNYILHDMMHDLARSMTRNDICSLLDLNETKNIPKDAKHIFINHDKATTKFPLFGAIRTFCIVVAKVDYNLYCKDFFGHFGCLRVLRIDAPKYACNLQFIDWIDNLQHLRYLSINVQSLQMEEHSLSSLYKLQTLKLESYKLCMLPRTMGKLINLRHLVLRCNIEMLPESICHLENLLTLDIKDCHLLRELPFGISKLTKLRHLMLPKVDDFCIPCGIEKLINLQTMPHYFLKRGSQHGEIGWLKHLVNLRENLEIFNLQNILNYENAKSSNLRSKPHIKILKLYWTDLMKDVECAQQEEEAILDGLQPHTNLKELVIIGYGDNIFPSWFGNPHFSNLTTISLKNFNSNEECKFLPLSRLPSLKSLFISNVKGIRNMGQDFWCYPYPNGHDNNFTEVHVGFPSLEVLSIIEMPEWEEWQMVKKGYFLSLKCLHIWFCPKLELLPTLPSSIEKFKVKSCERLKHLALHDSSGPPSRLQQVSIDFCSLLTSVKQVPDITHLEIRRCFNLKSVNRLDNILATLKVVILYKCPLLQLNPDEYSHHHSLASLSLDKGKFERAYVVNCPHMRKWCYSLGVSYCKGNSFKLH